MQCDDSLCPIDANHWTCQSKWRLRPLRPPAQHCSLNTKHKQMEERANLSIVQTQRIKSRLTQIQNFCQILERVSKFWLRIWHRKPSGNSSKTTLNWRKASKGAVDQKHLTVPLKASSAILQSPYSMSYSIDNSQLYSSWFSLMISAYPYLQPRPN